MLDYIFVCLFRDSNSKISYGLSCSLRGLMRDKCVKACYLAITQPPNHSHPSTPPFPRCTTSASITCSRYQASPNYLKNVESTEYVSLTASGHLKARIFILILAPTTSFHLYRSNTTWHLLTSKHYLHSLHRTLPLLDYCTSITHFLYLKLKLTI